VGMVAYVRLVPRLVPERTGRPDELPAPLSQLMGCAV
jgi:hypothetical protein